MRTLHTYRCSRDNQLQLVSNSSMNLQYSFELMRFA